MVGPKLKVGATNPDLFVLVAAEVWVRVPLLGLIWEVSAVFKSKGKS